MKYKTVDIEDDYVNQQDRSKFNLKLRRYVYILETISDLLGFGELTITDYMRHGDKYIHSLHHVKYGGRAADIRVRDKPALWYWMMVAIGKAIEIGNKQFRMNPHFELYGQPQQHIHIEIRE